MDKLTHLVRTLSRTQHKDYESYVVNAVWNRLGDSEIKPVTQQYVAAGPTGSRHFIDLYFPQVNIGIECNEPFHQGTREHDKQRTAAIFDVLRQVRPDSGYEQLDIDVVDPDTGHLRSLEELDAEIDRAVGRIRDAVRALRDNGTFEPWNPDIEDPVAAVQALDHLSVEDDIPFRTQVQACNALFGDDYAPKALRSSCLRTQGLRRVYGDEFKVWFPKAELDGKAVREGWHDVLSKDGLSIAEYNDEFDAVGPDGENASGHKRVVFIQTRDPLTGANSYRFVGVFERQGVTTVSGHRARHFVRIADSFPVIHRDEEAG